MSQFNCQGLVRTDSRTDRSGRSCNHVSAVNWSRQVNKSTSSGDSPVRWEDRSEVRTAQDTGPIRQVQLVRTQTPSHTVKPGNHDRIFGVVDATTRPHANQSESLILLAADLKYLEDTNNEPCDALDGVSGAKLDIKCARYPAGSWRRSLSYSQCERTWAMPQNKEQRNKKQQEVLHGQCSCT